MILRTSIGGRRARVKLSNAFNGTPVEIGAAHIAVRDKDSGIVAASDRAADVRRPAVDQDGARDGGGQRSGRPDRRAPHRPRRQPLLSRRHRRADDARDRAAADIHLARRRLHRQPDDPRRDDADVVLLARRAWKSPRPPARRSSSRSATRSPTARARRPTRTTPGRRFWRRDWPRTRRPPTSPSSTRASAATAC